MTFAADIAHLTQIAARLASPQAFYVAVLTRLTDAVLTVLRETTPGHTLPTQWRAQITPRGNKVIALIDHARVADDPDFERIMFYLDLGTADHFIAPVRASALHWIDPVTGEDRFSKGHTVSGIVASHFTAAALRVIAQQETFMRDAWQAYIETGRLP